LIQTASPASNTNRPQQQKSKITRRHQFNGKVMIIELN